MKKRNVVFLVGNGFNHFLYQYVNEENEEILLDKLKKDAKDLETAKSWLRKLKEGLGEYCKLLDFLELENYSSTGETLLSSLSDFFGSIEGENKEHKTIINDSLEKLVVSKIGQIFESTAIVKEKNNGATYINATARKIMFNRFKKTGKTFAKNIDLLVKEVSDEPYDIYTTNYDFIVGSVFTEYNSHMKKPDNFKKGEHFTKLHGQYNISGDSDLICCAPKEKVARISPKVFSKFSSDINKADILVLFGMGLTSDPHILNEINKKKDIEVVIIDANKDKYYRDHYHQKKVLKNEKDNNNFDFLKNNRVYFIDTLSHQYTNFYVDKVNTPEKLMGDLEVIFGLIASGANR